MNLVDVAPPAASLDPENVLDRWWAWSGHIPSDDVRPCRDHSYCIVEYGEEHICTRRYDWIMESFPDRNAYYDDIGGGDGPDYSECNNPADCMAAHT